MGLLTVEPDVFVTQEENRVVWSRACLETQIVTRELV